MIRDLLADIALPKMGRLAEISDAEVKDVGCGAARRDSAVRRLRDA